VAHLVPVVIGQDNGATVEIISGLSANDRVIQDPPDSIIEGEKLYVESPGQNGNQPSGAPHADIRQQDNVNQPAPASPQGNPGGK
jgi:hypothetical protein